MVVWVSLLSSRAFAGLGFALFAGVLRCMLCETFVKGDVFATRVCIVRGGLAVFAVSYRFGR